MLRQAPVIRARSILSCIESFGGAVLFQVKTNGLTQPILRVMDVADPDFGHGARDQGGSARRSTLFG
jgi:hypothetical protein